MRVRMKTTTLLILGAAAAGAAWWWWSKQAKAAPAPPRTPAGLTPVVTGGAIDWGFVDSLPVPGLTRMAADGMRVLPTVFVD
jgi:hypothetical protein